MAEWITRYFLPICLLAAFGFTFVWLTKFKKRLCISTPVTLLVSVVHIIVGVFCVKAFAFLESGAAPGGFSQMSIFGATFFMPVGYYVGARLTKRKAADVFDIFTVCMVFTLACSRVNCLVSGCCSGIPFFGTSFCWPTREIEILFYLAFIAWQAPRVLKGKTNGEVYPQYMFLYGLLRFLLEFVRVSNASSLLHLTHLWAAVALTLGLAIWLELRARARRNTLKRK